MAFNIWQFLIAAVTILAASSTTAESIQLQPTQGILIPAPLTDNYRVTRSAYGGGGGGGGSSYSAPAAPSYSAPAAPAPIYSAPAPAPAPAPISIPAPPCPRNYVFSCQPSLQPVPCSAPAPASAPAYSAPAPAAAYSSPQGAYSQFAPQYVLPPTSYGVPVVKELY